MRHLVLKSPGLKFRIEKLMVEKFRIEKSMVAEKYRIEKLRV